MERRNNPAGLALIAGLSFVAGVSGCLPIEYVPQQQETRVSATQPVRVAASQPAYDWNDFASAVRGRIGEKKWNEVEGRIPVDLKENWMDLGERQRKLWTEIYVNPRRTYESRGFKGEAKKKFDRFNPKRHLSEDSLSIYMARTPWIDFERISLADKLFIWYVEAYDNGPYSGNY